MCTHQAAYSPAPHPDLLPQQTQPPLLHSVPQLRDLLGSPGPHKVSQFLSQLSKTSWPELTTSHSQPAPGQWANPCLLLKHQASCFAQAASHIQTLPTFRAQRNSRAQAHGVWEALYCLWDCPRLGGSGGVDWRRAGRKAEGRVGGGGGEVEADCLACTTAFATVGQGLHPAAGGGVALPAQPQHPPPGHKGTCPNHLASPEPWEGQRGAWGLQAGKAQAHHFQFSCQDLLTFGDGKLTHYFTSSPCRWGVTLIEQRLPPNGTEICSGPHWPLPLMEQLFTDSLVTPLPQTWQPQESPP